MHGPASLQNALTPAPAPRLSTYRPGGDERRPELQLLASFGGAYGRPWCEPHLALLRHTADGGVRDAQRLPTARPVLRRNGRVQVAVMTTESDLGSAGSGDAREAWDAVQEATPPTPDPQTDTGPAEKGRSSRGLAERHSRAVSVARGLQELGYHLDETLRPGPDMAAG